MEKTSLDIIIPVFDEEEILETLFTRLNECMSERALDDYSLGPVRYIFVDDGSRDRTATLIRDKISFGANAALIRLSRNFGHQSALIAGFDHSTADIVAVIDADLQDPPELIPEMTRKLREGYDVVYGERKRRQGNTAKVLLYWIYYRILRVLSDVDLPVDAGDFCVMRRRVLVAMRSLPEKLRFSRGLRCWVGFNQVAFPYDRPLRAAGSTKYSLGRLYQLATDGIASMSVRPLRITQATLFFSLFATVCFLILASYQYIRHGSHDPLTLWFLMGYILIAFTSSLQIFCLYIMGAYLGRMYLEVKARPPYIVMETIEPNGRGQL